MNVEKVVEDFAINVADDVREIIDFVLCENDVADLIVMLFSESDPVATLTSALVRDAVISIVKDLSVSDPLVTSNIAMLGGVDGEMVRVGCTPDSGSIVTVQLPVCVVAL